MSSEVLLTLRAQPNGYGATVVLPAQGEGDSSWVLTARFPHGEEHRMADEISELVVAWLEAGGLGVVSVLQTGWRS